MRFPPVTLCLPDWVHDMLADPYCVYPTVEDRIRFVTELYQAHVRHGTGLPFGAKIFDREKGKLLTPVLT
jgi:hypothetical protein